jgi:hypothetical protein
MIPTSIDFYNTIVINEFMNSRVVDLEDGDIISEGYFVHTFKISFKVQALQGEDKEN